MIGLLCLAGSAVMGQGLDLAQLQHHWVHAREEDSQEGKEKGLLVYYPKGSREFRPSRFRMEYDLQAGGKCRWMELSPSDAHQLQPGSWRLRSDGKGAVLEIREGKITKRFEVVELKKDKLRLRSLAN